jgi:hypothetical protein
MNTRNLFAAGAVLLIAGTATKQALAYDLTSFTPGTYEFSDERFGPVVDTLVVSISGGTADFTLTGQDNETFAILNNSVAAGYIAGGNGDPYFFGSAIKSPSWSIVNDPYVTFWTATDEGGLTISAVPGDSSRLNLVDVVSPSRGTGQVYTTVDPVPLPGALALFGAGITGLGFIGWKKTGRISAS